MNFQELLATIPNGFHDAELQRVDMDYVQRRLQLDLVVWIGDMTGDMTKRELYRPAHVTLNKVTYFVVEPPDHPASLLEGDSIRIDAGEGIPQQISGRIPVLPPGNAITWLFLTDLNTFLMFSAGEASLE